MPVNISLPHIPPDDAISHLRQWLNVRVRRRRESQNSERFQFDLFSVVDALMEREQSTHRQQNPVGIVTYRRDPFPNSASFQDAVWELTGRGILRPSLVRNSSSVEFNGREFVLTEYGERWVTDSTQIDLIPSESGRFAGALGSYAWLFGAAYHAKSQEAMACYQAHAYLACCAMCGAAAEAILLLIAITRHGDRDEVLALYRRASGRSQIESIVVQHLNSRIRDEILQFTALLKYWRDSASHVSESRLTEQEAFMAMLLLLRFASFAHERWRDITGSDRPGT
jgi:hypothetical protein